MLEFTAEPLAKGEPGSQSKAQPERNAASTSVDGLDGEIFRLSMSINAATYRLLVLVREFDDRFGWAKWSFGNCSEWLAWRCGISLSAAREKICELLVKAIDRAVESGEAELGPEFVATAGRRSRRMV